MREKLKEGLAIIYGGKKEVAKRAGIAPINVTRILDGKWDNDAVIEIVRDVVEDNALRALSLIGKPRTKVVYFENITEKIDIESFIKGLKMRPNAEDHQPQGQTPPSPPDAPH